MVMGTRAGYDDAMIILQRYIDLCLFKKGPADIPASDNLLRLTLLVYFILGVAISRIDSDWNVSLFTSLTDMIFMIIVVNILLKFRNFQSRYKQTLTALAGAGACLGLIGLPIMMWFNQVPEIEQATSYAMLLMVVIMFWSLMVTAHIFRHALEIKPGSAAVLTVIYTILSLLTLGLTMSGVA